MLSDDQAAAEQAQALCRWYEGVVRSFLAVHAKEQLPQLDDDHARLKRALAQSHETAVCFVGGAGIGKSTLLNAIVAGRQTLVPSGGIGPLTALATEVRFSPVARLRMEYHPKAHLWRVAAVLSFHVRRQQQLQADAAVEAAGIEDGEDIRTLESGASGRMQELIRTARLLVTGGQSETRPVEYLADALSEACSVKPRWGTTLSEGDAGRVARIRQALQMAERKEALVQEQGPSGLRPLQETLREHAAGFLSPLIRRIEVGWPGEILESGLVTVDLPGVGVAGDLHRNETQQFVRERARAMVLVVGRSGVMEPEMELLRSTGFWDRLLLESDQPDSDACALVVAVTHVDDVAYTEWLDQPTDDDGLRPRSRAQVFADVQARVREQMRGQLEQQLLELTQTDSSEAIREARQSAVRNIMASLEIHPVSAVEYCRLLRRDPDDQSYLPSAEASGVPGLAQSLAQRASRARDARLDTVRRVAGRLAESLSDQLRTLESAWRAGGDAAEARRVRDALQELLADRKREYELRRASFRTFLNETVPEKIRVAALEAQDEAERGIVQHLRTLEQANVATLRAAVVRGGTYHGARHINLPADIALRFQDPLAAAWSLYLLKPIRQRTYDHALEIRGLVEHLWDWIEREAASQVGGEVITAQRRLLAAQSDRLRDVGNDGIAKLRSLIKVKLVEAIAGPIREACREFVQAGRSDGFGVKNRILEMFGTLAAAASKAASKLSVSLLVERYVEISAEIEKAFVQWDRPLDRAARLILEPYEERIRCSEIERQKLLEEIQAIRAQAPGSGELPQETPEAPQPLRAAG